MNPKVASAGAVGGRIGPYSHSLALVRLPVSNIKGEGGILQALEHVGRKRANIQWTVVMPDVHQQGVAVPPSPRRAMVCCTHKCGAQVREGWATLLSHSPLYLRLGLRRSIRAA
eukprot:scaffold1380_cov374-Prasinococcus_capsulatus_cf.AAC.5